MNVKEKAKLKNNIQTQIDALRQTLGALEEKNHAIEPCCSLGRLTRSEAMVEQEINNKILEDSKRRLNRLNYALSHINDEDFGICEVCDESIPYARMEIIPESRVCVICAQD